jgi:hypothetical protein
VPKQNTNVKADLIVELSVPEAPVPFSSLFLFYLSSELPKTAQTDFREKD